MYNLIEMKQKSAQILQRTGDADYLMKIETWLNLAHKLGADAYDFWAGLQAEPPYRFTSVADQEKYYLPSDFDKPYRLFDRTNNIKMTWKTREEYYSANISSVTSANTGTPQAAMLHGVSPVSYVKTSSFTLKVKSSASTDNSGITIRVEGWLDSAKTILGYEDIVISTSDPTTYAATSSPTTFYGVTRLTKSADTDGYVTIANNSSTVVAVIAPYDRESRYPVLYLGLIPNDAITYEVLYKRKIKKLADDNDYPFADICDFMILHAVGYGLSEEKEATERADQMWKRAEALLMNNVRNEQLKNGTDFQHKFITQTAQSHRS